MRIIRHLVKLEYSPAAEPRSGWRRTIRLARLQVQKRVEDNPSLKPELGSLIEGETRRGSNTRSPTWKSTARSTRSMHGF
jgi:Domain of unknown function DUF29